MLLVARMLCVVAWCVLTVPALCCLFAVVCGCALCVAGAVMLFAVCCFRRCWLLSLVVSLLLVVLQLAVDVVCCVLFVVADGCVLRFVVSVVASIPFAVIGKCRCLLLLMCVMCC